MRISELSSRTGIPVATIKFYLRENLLHEGVLTAATQAHYDESHMARLRLIRALLGPGGLSVAAAHRVIQAIDEPPQSLHELLGVAVTALSGPNLEDALRALDEAGFELPDGALDVYREHMRQVAQFEIDHIPTDSPTAAVRYVVLGTVLVEPLILALRRQAEQEASARRFGVTEPHLVPKFPTSAEFSARDWPVSTEVSRPRSLEETTGGETGTA